MIEINKLRGKNYTLCYNRLAIWCIFFQLYLIFYCYLYLVPEGQNLTLFQLHKSFPLLYIIDTATSSTECISIIVMANIQSTE